MNAAASDDDGSNTPRSVRFLDRPRDACDGEIDPGNESETSHRASESEANTHKEYSSTQRY